MMEVAEGKKPVWMVLQISWSGVLKPGLTLRFPTFPEERFMSYQAIINGARGLIYFGGNNEAAMSDADKKLGWNWTFWKRVLRPVVEEIGTKTRSTLPWLRRTRSCQLRSAEARHGILRARKWERSIHPRLQA